MEQTKRDRRYDEQMHCGDAVGGLPFASAVVWAEVKPVAVERKSIPSENLEPEPLRTPPLTTF